MANAAEIRTWGVDIGYDKFVETASRELTAVGAEVLKNITPETVRDSLWHPNGFLVHTLESNTEGQLRLHIWPTGRLDDLTPHSHPWHMASLVLGGVYTEHIPEVRLDDTSTHELMIPIFNEARQNVGIGSSGRTVRFDLGNLVEYPAGSIHTLPAGTFHATPLPQEKPIVTLLRTGPQLYDNPSFVKRALNQQEQLTTVAGRQPPSPDEAEIIWEQVSELLAV